MGKEVKIGQQDYSVLVFIPDPASTDGSGKTGLNAAALTVSGIRVETDNDVTVTDYTGLLNDLALLTSAHNDWGILEISSTLCPGLYRLDIADAIFLTGAWQAVVYVQITTSAAAATPIEFTLVPESPYSGVTATSAPAVILADGAHGGAGTTIMLQTPIAATVPDTQKVDVNTIKTQTIACAAGVTVLASVGTAGTAIAQTGDSYAIVNGDHGLVSIQDDIDALLADVGDASASTLGSLYAILGNAAATLTSRIPAALDGGNMAAQVKGQDNIDFGALQKASITAAVPTTANIKTAMEATGSDLDFLIRALVNKIIFTEADGTAELFTDAGVSAGTVATCFSSVAGFTTRKALRIV